KLTVADYAAVAYYDSACSNPVVDDNGEAVNPTDAGTYYVRIEAKDSGNATGASLAVPFKVAPKDIAPDTDTKTMTYNGEDQSPLIVKDGALELEENVDYTVVYKNTKSATVKPRNVATYSAEITAVADGNYTFRSGTSVADVEITPLEVVIDKNVYSVDPQVATGEQITPDVPNALDVTADVINAAGESVEKTFMLKKTTDYTVTYGANTAIAADGGSVIFTEVANSNFTINSNPASVKFDIAAINDLAVAKVSAVDPQTFTGKPLRPAVSVVAADGKMLVENIDYALSYINNIEVGIAAVIVKGMGSYVGSTDVSFRIVSGTQRIEGANRFETMSNLVSGGFESAETVIVTNGMKAPDALAASGLAGVSNAPIITTEGEALNAFAAETISNLGASKAIVLGDEASISGAVVASLEAMGLSVERVQGDTRIETNLAIYEAGKASYGKTAILASGWEAADALSAASYAYATGSAVFLANEDGSVDERISEILLSGAFDRVIVLGGEDRVSAKERMELKAGLGETAVVEFAGTDRFDTSAQLIEFAAAEGAVNFSTVYVTTGFNFADALAAGAPAGKQGIPVLLVADDANAYAAIDRIIGEHQAEIRAVNVLGDSNAVSAKVEAYIAEVLKK
ncbi:MAG: cell wall-binding repeat-containing protein, partial [Raoultibacter sp.]